MRPLKKIKIDMNEENLKDRINEAREQSGLNNSESAKDQKKKGMGKDARIGIEFVGAIAGSAFIGFFLDRQFETSPLFMFLFLFAGVATGFYNIYRVTNNHGNTVGYAHLKEGSEKKLSEEQKDAKNNEN